MMRHGGLTARETAAERRALDLELAALPRHIWDSVFTACATRIRSRGSVSGTIVLTDPEVVRHVEGMGCPVRRGTMRLRELDAALRGGRFREGLLAVVERWTGAAIITKWEERNAEARAWDAQWTVWRDAITRPEPQAETAPDMEAALLGWLEASARTFKARWRKQPEATHLAVLRAIAGARRAPGLDAVASVIALPVFAEQVAGDPHAFDATRRTGRWLVAALRARFLGDVELRGLRGAEERAAVLDAAGLSTDGISSRVVVFGLAGAHPLLRAAHEAGEPVMLTQLNLERLDQVAVPSGVAHVVENPAVFTSIVRRLMAQPGGGPAPTLVCTSGQFGVTAAGILDRIAATGAAIRYSGDFDPDGIRIADRVWRRYPSQMVPWRLDRATYQAARAREWCATQVEDEARRSSVRPWPEERERLLTAITMGGKVYQEALVETLIDDVVAGARPSSPRIAGARAH